MIENTLMDDHQILLDEIILQICKQLNKNKKEEATSKIFDFTLLFLSLFSPSARLTYPLLNHFYNKMIAEDLAPEFRNKSRIIFNRLSRVAQAYEVLTTKNIFKENSDELLPDFANAEIIADNNQQQE